MSELEVEDIVQCFKGIIEDWETKREWAKYRWEFMRRSPQYIKDFETVERIRKDVALQAGLKPTWTDASDFMTYPDGFKKEANMELDLCNKHGLRTNTLLDPKKSFEEIVGSDLPEELPKKNLQLSNQQLMGLFLASLINPPSAHFLDFDSDEPEKLSIEIDFKFVNSISILKRQIADEIQEHYDSELKDQKQKKMSGPGYEVILRVGELKESGMTFEQIAEKIDPIKYKEKPVSTTRNMGHYFKKYKYLINGGYINMTF
jgi:hypothetical protein